MIAPVVLVTSREVQTVEGRYRQVLEAAGFVVRHPPEADANLLTPAELREQLVGVEATIAGSERYDAALFAAFPQLRVVARVGVGYDAVDVPAATAHGVVVTVAPGTNHESAAEHAFALLLGFTRLIPTRTALVRQGKWPMHMSRPLRGRTLGLAGLGRIGRAVADRALAFRMQVIAYDPHWSDHPGVERVSFEQLLAEADYLSLHLPLTPQTHHLMNRDAFSGLNPGAVLVNTSRGGLVDEAALLEVLRSGRLAGAALDVLEQEPPPPDHPLFLFENVVLTPHAAGVDVQSLGDMAHSAAVSIIDLARGAWPTEKVVNGDVQARWKS